MLFNGNYHVLVFLEQTGRVAAVHTTAVFREQRVSLKRQ